MIRSSIGRIASLSLTLAITTMACTPGLQTEHVAGLSDLPTNRVAARAAERARLALDRKQGDIAIRHAEAAVTAAPRSADYRVLLAQAYLATGRFASAGTAAREALTLSPELPRARLTLALAEVAEGHDEAARGQLAAIGTAAPRADLGLALALAGAPRDAIDMLAGLVREGASDARTRQNLAFALAMDGRWREARATAMQDTPPDAIDAQIAQWTRLAQTGDGKAMLAAMLATQPADGDPGEPVALALSSPADRGAVRIALGPPHPSVPDAPVPLVALAAPPRTSVTLDLAPPPMLLASAAPRPLARQHPVTARMQAPMHASPLPIARPLMPATRLVTLYLDPPATPRHAKPMVQKIARIVPTPARPVPISATIRKPGGNWVVQLGAYSHGPSLEAAWRDAARSREHLAGLTPLVGHSVGLMRLSLSGFDARSEADRVCRRLRSGGSGCFVRPIQNDRPLQPLSQPLRREYVRLAMR